MNTVKTFHLEDLCILEGKWKSTIGQLHCLEFPQSYYLPGLRNHRRISWADLFIFFPHAVPFPFTFGWTRSNPNVPFLPRWPNNPTLDIQPEPFSSFANFITAFKLMRSAEWTEKSISETLICVLFLVVLADWPRYCSKQKTMCQGPARVGFRSSRSEKWKRQAFTLFREVQSEKKMLSLFFEKCKVKNKCFHSFSRSEKWNQNASRSRSRSENSREFWTILEKRDFWTGWNQLVRKPGAEQGGGAHNCQWKRGEGDLFQAELPVQVQGWLQPHWSEDRLQQDGWQPGGVIR